MKQSDREMSFHLKVTGPGLCVEAVPYGKKQRPVLHLQTPNFWGEKLLFLSESQKLLVLQIWDAFFLPCETPENTFY